MTPVPVQNSRMAARLASGRGGGCLAALRYPFPDLGEQADELVLLGLAERGHAVFLDVDQRWAKAVDGLASGWGELGIVLRRSLG